MYWHYTGSNVHYNVITWCSSINYCYVEVDGYGRMMGGQGWEFLPILAVWLVLVSYRHRHLVVGILVGIFGTVPFGGNPVLTVWQEIIFWRIWWKLRMLKIPIPMCHHVLYSKYGSKTKNHFPPQPKNWHNSTTGKKVPPTHAQQVYLSIFAPYMGIW